MTNLYEIVSKDMLCYSTFESHKLVQNFMESNENDPDYKQKMINAYIVRDVYYRGNLNLKEIMEQNCSKLNLNPTESQKQKKYENEFLNNIKNMIKNKEFVEDSIENYYNKFINREDTLKEIEDKEKYNKIMELINNGSDIENVYNEFSIEDLLYLGW